MEFAADLSMTNAALLSFMGIADWDAFANVEEHLATSLAEVHPMYYPLTHIITHRKLF